MPCNFIYLTEGIRSAIIISSVYIIKHVLKIRTTLQLFMLSVELCCDVGMETAVV